MAGDELARVVGLWRYPVKSMAAEALEDVEVSWYGLAGDRRWAFVQEALPRSGFPWLTIRERREMQRYVPAFADPARPDASTALITTPGGEVLDILDPALAAELGGGVRVLKQDRGTFDSLPLSLISTRSIAGLGALVDTELDVRRFRPNLLVEPAGDAPFPEDGWVGRVLQIGEVQMRVDRRDTRCVIITQDPATLERDPVVLKTLGRRRDTCLGVYGTTVRPGRISVGDAVTAL